MDGDSADCLVYKHYIYIYNVHHSVIVHWFKGCLQNLKYARNRRGEFMELNLQYSIVDMQQKLHI